MKLIKIITVATLAFMLGAWSSASRSEDYSKQDESANSSPASLFYATATFTDGSGNNQNDFAQPIGISPGSNTPADGYIVDPVNNQVNLKFTIYNGQSSFGYKSGNIQIYWSTIPAGYASTSAFMKAVKVSGTKGSGKINNNGLYVWTSKKALKPGKIATVMFQFPLYTSNGTTIKTTGTYGQGPNSPPIPLLNQGWSFTTSIQKQAENISSSVYLSGTVNLEQVLVSFQSSGCIPPNPSSSPDPVGGPVSLSYLIFPTYTNSKNTKDAFVSYTWSEQNGQNPLCAPNYAIGIINANYTFGAVYQCKFCECPNCGVVCNGPEPPVSCWSAATVYKNTQCTFQKYSNTLPGTFTFSGPSSSGNPTTSAYCCPTMQN
ncbi:hypothetical protein [Methylococcus mesophilus]|uniref:hypothetical protein n=1 Tax=Methylococcus mesophilus TaxID=2993564 RepID=UPI00224B7BBA|nr:hypothetical protein [Methylococcus mesophilus]UZR30198.1 hypothetical protein OOT43_06030 [Methylococcus mesophilus]